MTWITENLHIYTDIHFESKCLTFTLLFNFNQFINYIHYVIYRLLDRLDG